MEQKLIGDYIRNKRKDVGLTQREVAEKLFVTEQAVSKWERGLSFPDKDLLLPLSKILDITVMELLNGGPICPNNVNEAANVVIIDSIDHFEKAVAARILKYCLLAFAVVAVLASAYTIRAEQNFRRCLSDSFSEYSQAFIYDGLISAYMIFEDAPTITNYTNLMLQLSSTYDCQSELYSIASHPTVLSNASAKELCNLLLDAENASRKLRTLLSGNDKDNIAASDSMIIFKSDDILEESSKQLSMLASLYTEMNSSLSKFDISFPSTPAGTTLLEYASSHGEFQ